MTKVLLVQPDTATSRDMVRSLKFHEVDCVCATSQKQAMRALEGDYLIDAVLVTMGRGNCCGHELLQSIRENIRFQSLPVLILCSSCAADVVVEALRRGATDVISFSISPEQIAQRIEAAVDKGRRHILVVDDETVIREYLSDMLRIERFYPVVACSGNEALTILESTSIQAVISDIMMPGMSGMELLVQIKQRYDNLAVILITGYGGKYASQQAVAAGADGYFQKPFKNVELIRTLRAVLGASAKTRKAHSQSTVR